ncbi:MAG TPA: GNAT family N-acetyltransferase [Ktedonobacteraceae bacterium]|jgi:GNAT superfamily N-acetyltransferase
MAVMLKNLVARAPQVEDRAALSELIALCEHAEESAAGSLLEDVLSHWQHPDFHLADDARVIVTTRGQMAGFVSVWHEHRARICTFLCVHPEYRRRGVGTLLLRLAELRARQLLCLAPADARVVLRGVVGKANKGAQRLCEQEGYVAERQFLRLSFFLAEDSGAQPLAPGRQKLNVDIGLEQEQLIGAAALYDRDGLCSVQAYRVYEKELRPAARVSSREMEQQAPGCYASQRVVAGTDRGAELRCW